MFYSKSFFTVTNLLEMSYSSFEFVHTKLFNPITKIIQIQIYVTIIQLKNADMNNVCLQSL